MWQGDKSWHTGHQSSRTRIGSSCFSNVVKALGRVSPIGQQISRDRFFPHPKHARRGHHAMSPDSGHSFIDLLPRMCAAAHLSASRIHCTGSLPRVQLGSFWRDDEYPKWRRGLLIYRHLACWSRVDPNVKRRSKSSSQSSKKPHSSCPIVSFAHHQSCVCEEVVV